VNLQIVDRLLLIDAATDALAVTAMDLSLMSSATSSSEVFAVDAEGLADTDVVILAAGVPHRDGEPRSAFARANLAILRSVVAVLPSGWSGLFVVASNPVDVLTTVAHHKLPDATVLGYTRNDSLRLAQGIGLALGAPACDVRAWSLGEHGPAAVPLLDRIELADAPVRLTEPQREIALGWWNGWYDRWQQHRSGRTSMWTTGCGLGDLVAAFLGAQAVIVPASAPVDGLYGIREDVCLGLPVRLGDRSAEVLTWDLSADQVAGMRAGAAAVAALATS
jgi:L-lactate dehydrogenase